MLLLVAVVREEKRRVEILRNRVAIAAKKRRPSQVKAIENVKSTTFPSISRSHPTPDPEPILRQHACKALIEALDRNLMDNMPRFTLQDAPSFTVAKAPLSFASLAATSGDTGFVQRERAPPVDSPVVRSPDFGECCTLPRAGSVRGLCTKNTNAGRPLSPRC